MKVLLVEDDPLTRRLLETVIRSCGYEVTACADAETAWEIYQQEAHPLIVLDWVLPGMDGLQLCRRMRLLPQGNWSVILIITVRDQVEDLREVLEAGADDYLSKPVDVRLLKVRLAIAERRIRDLLERKRAEEAMRLRDRAIAAASSGIAITDPNQPDNPVIYCNPALERITGYTQAEILGRNLRFLQGPDTDPATISEIRNALREERECWVVLKNYRKDGSPFWNELTIAPVRDEKGRLTHFIGVQTDITQRKRDEETIRHLAYDDALTGLPNRTLFNDRLTLALAQAHRNQGRLAVMLMDLDRFKIINDTLGHAVGDQLLRGVARRLINSLREGDTVARLGDDEFAFLLPGMDQVEDVAKTAQKIIEILKSAFYFEGHELHVTPSIGIALYPNDGEDAQTLLKNANTALHRAKEQGRNTYQLYTPAMNATALERLALESRLYRALEREEFVIYYQPQINIHTGKVVGVEALVRWRHPKLGLILPGKFIPLAEETGFIIPLGEWVLLTACAQNKAWQDAGLPPLRMAVNLSISHFKREDLTKMLAQVLEKTGLHPSYLELELTESIGMENVERAITKLQELKALGVKLSIDDFGTGYSSLSYLKRFPIDTLKIDQSFVQHIPTNPNDAAITTAIIAMAHSLNLKVIAEGVETEEQLTFLRPYRCDEMQGFLFSKPMPAEEFIQFFREKMTDNPR
ncbi:MAG TPA: EAL domain-containing protein [Candidatus Limnocylindrales bacterium]|nr:EAL domain-containing protein [Candidatus Limnocylindrales bacterium]